MTTSVEGYLKQYREADRRARRLRQEYDKEKAEIDEIKSPLGSDGMPHGTGISKSVENRAIRLADKLLEYEDARIEAIEIRQMLFDAIMQIGGIESDVLYDYYVDYFDKRWNKSRTWEDVAEMEHVSLSTVHRVKERAYKKLTLNDTF